MYANNLNISDLKDKYRNCTLCPRECSVNRENKKGFCGATDKMEVSRIAPHYLEEPPISGKNGSGTIFFSHCNLGCIFCQNQDISRCDSVGKEFSPDELSDKMLSLQKSGVHNINLVTATHYLPGIAETIILARQKGLNIPIVYNCGGFENAENIRLLDGLIDIYLPDFKYFSTYYSNKYSKTEDYYDNAVASINEMVRQCPEPHYDENEMLVSGVIIRHLILPGLVSDTSQVLRTIGEKWCDNVLVSLMHQYTPTGENLPSEINRPINDYEYESAVDQFELLGLEGFIQQRDSVGEDKIPQWNSFI